MGLFLSLNAARVCPGQDTSGCVAILFSPIVGCGLDRFAQTGKSLEMIRKAFVMKVNPGCEAEYELRHNPIWRELEEVLTAHGVHNYSIFLDPETRALFGYAEVEDEARWHSIAQSEICRKWWGHMADVMETNPDQSPAARDLREVFHLSEPE